MGAPFFAVTSRYAPATRDTITGAPGKVWVRQDANRPAEL